MGRVVFSLLFTLATLTLSLALDCGCLNSGQCLEKNSRGFCQCPGGFLDTRCGQAGSELVQQSIPAEIGEDYSYYFVTFNATTLYFVQFIICPASFQAGAVFQIYIEMEGEDGSIEPHPKEKDKNLFQPETTQCMVFKLVLLAFQIKPNGDYTRLVLRTRTLPTPAAGNQTAIRVSDPAELSTSNLLRLSVIKYQLYQGMQDFQIGEFLAFSTLSILFVLFVLFVICRKYVQRRLPRLHYEPAEVVHDINHFEALMPSYHYPEDVSLPEDEKECMICLMTVQLTRVRTTPCGHLFHAECIDQWGRKKLLCPTCRSPLAPLPLADSPEQSQL